MSEADLLLPGHHPRARGANRYVYLVRSRRAGGLSIGINLDPQKTCNFDCVYCEVIDRRDVARRAGRPVIVADDVADELRLELGALVGAGRADELRDIAFAGDGEPSTYPGFLALSRRLLAVRDAAGLGRLPLVLITNGSGLDRAEMREAHDLFAARGGAFWIKLDAGTEAFYRTVCRTSVPFERVLGNLLSAARRHPVVVQSLFFRWNGAAPEATEIAAWARRIHDVREAGGEIALVQVYTVARDTTEPGIEPLTREELEAIARRVERTPTAIYP